MQQPAAQLPENTDVRLVGFNTKNYSQYSKH